MDRCRIVQIAFLITLCCLGSRSFGEEFDQNGLEFFAKRIRPLLAENCYQCHSEKAEKLESNLHVDSREGLLKGGDRGPAIESGEPSKSLLIQAVKYDMDDLKMPPDRRLEDKEIADLEKWIKIGAPAPAKPEKKLAANNQLPIHSLPAHPFSRSDTFPNRGREDR